MPRTVSKFRTAFKIKVRIVSNIFYNLYIFFIIFIAKALQSAAGFREPVLLVFLGPVQRPQMCIDLALKN